MQRKGILLAGGWGSQMGTRPLREAGLDAEMLGRGCAWPEAIAFRPGWIEAAQLERLAAPC